MISKENCIRYPRIFLSLLSPSFQISLVSPQLQKQLEKNAKLDPLHWRAAVQSLRLHILGEAKLRDKSKEGESVFAKGEP